MVGEVSIDIGEQVNGNHFLVETGKFSYSPATTVVSGNQRYGNWAMDQSIRAQWSAELLTSDVWEPAGRAGCPGEAGGGFLRNQRTLEIAWMKPIRHDPNHAHAAREKIASDLARMVDISVPPVLLYRRHNAPPNEAPVACLSLVCYPQQYEWGDVFSIGSSSGWLLPHSQHSVEQALADASGAVAFDAWLANEDRNNSRNVLLGYDAAKSGSSNDLGEFLFLDFSNSMRWGTAESTFERVNVPPLFSAALNFSQAMATVAKIEALEDAKIESTLARIPDDFIQDGSRRLILQGLLHRKRRLRQDANLWYPGTVGAL